MSSITLYDNYPPRETARGRFKEHATSLRFDNNERNLVLLLLLFIATRQLLVLSQMANKLKVFFSAL